MTQMTTFLVLRQNLKFVSCPSLPELSGIVLKNGKNFIFLCMIFLMHYTLQTRYWCGFSDLYLILPWIVFLYRNDAHWNGSCSGEYSTLYSLLAYVERVAYVMAWEADIQNLNYCNDCAWAVLQIDWSCLDIESFFVYRLRQTYSFWIKVSSTFSTSLFLSVRLISWFLHFCTRFPPYQF